jgi:hypothetical protein
MRQFRRAFVSVIVASAVMAGCGGSSMTPETAAVGDPAGLGAAAPAAVNTSSDSVATPATASPFVAQPKVLPAFGDHFPPRTAECGSFTSTVSAVDLNRDGRKDLVVHQWCSVFAFGTVVDTPTPDALAVYLQRASGEFELANDEVFGRDDVRILAATRKVVVGDFNADGYPDLA